MGQHEEHHVTFGKRRLKIATRSMVRHAPSRPGRWCAGVSRESGPRAHTVSHIEGLRAPLSAGNKLLVTPPALCAPCPRSHWRSEA